MWCRQATGSPSSLILVLRYNTPNSTSDTDAVAHAAENWMISDGTDIGFNDSTTFTQDARRIRICFRAHCLLASLHTHWRTYRLGQSWGST
ncbi:hypothetical protein BDR05DRAFT_958577 [Suillus weaverae]|nr:hypothetical protein BDR05DRAFT_958577 [Suillus weaverae]